MANYVKFVKGTQAAYNALLNGPVKPTDDTLYFITSEPSNEVILYLGTKMVAGGGDDLQASSIDALQDVIISEGLSDRSFLIYDEEQKAWIDAPIEDLAFVGATKDSFGKSGLVPEPAAGEVNSFLRSDGNWAKLEIPEILSADSVSVSIEDSTIALANYGKQYYKYIAATDVQEAYYQLQIVDENNPWKAGLEPRVTLENDKLILGWYEPNPTTIEGVADQLTSISGKLDEVEAETEELKNSISEKADADSVYTSEQVDTKISEAIAAADHLKRVIVESVDKIDLTAANVEQYIYMVPIENGAEENKYNEYIVVTHNDIKSIEQVGSWSVDLSQYATKEDLKLKVDKVDGSRLMTNAEGTKLAGIEEGAQKNLIKSVSSHFNLNDAGHLTLVGIPNDLDLSENATIQSLKNSVTNLNNIVSNETTGLVTKVADLERRVTNLENKEYVTSDTFNTAMSDINERLTWQSI